MMSLSFETSLKTVQISLPEPQGKWLEEVLPLLGLDQPKAMTAAALQESFAAAGLDDFDLFWYNKPMNQLHEAGLWVL